MTSPGNDNEPVTWHYIAASTAALFFADNGIAIAEWKGKKICIAQQDNAFYAFAYKCPHAGAPLSTARLMNGAAIICPVHRYKFSLKNGYNTSGEGYYLKTWPVKVTTAGVYIGEKNTNNFWKIFQ